MQRLSLPLLVIAIMTPQITETLYSPALTAIRSDFGISAAQAGQTLSIYFFAFALGVAFWEPSAIDSAAVRRCWPARRSIWSAPASRC